MEGNKKVLENRVRRTLERRGYRLEKSRARDPLSLAYGKYFVWNQNNSLLSLTSGQPAFSAAGPETAQGLLKRLRLPATECSATLEEIAAWLDSMSREANCEK